MSLSDIEWNCSAFSDLAIWGALIDGIDEAVSPARRSRASASSAPENGTPLASLYIFGAPDRICCCLLTTSLHDSERAPRFLQLAEAHKDEFILHPPPPAPPPPQDEWVSVFYGLSSCSLQDGASLPARRAPRLLFIYLFPPSLPYTAPALAGQNISSSPHFLSSSRRRLETRRACCNPPLANQMDLNIFHW